MKTQQNTQQPRPQDIERITGYHATEIERKDAILDKGLTAWETDARGANNENRRSSCVYLFTTLPLAQQFASDNFFAGYIILGIDCRGLDIIADREYDEGEAVRCFEDIPADRIEIIEEGA